MENLTRKLLAAQKACGELVKTGKMAFGSKYEFATENDVLDAVKDPMLENGLVLLKTDVEVQVSAVPPSSDGKAQTQTLAVVTYNLVDAESGESMEVMGAGLIIGTDDKGVTKAIKSAKKYLLMDLFMLEEGVKNVATEATAKTQKPAAKPKEPDVTVTFTEEQIKTLKGKLATLCNNDKETYNKVVDAAKSAGYTVVELMSKKDFRDLADIDLYLEKK